MTSAKPETVAKSLSKRIRSGGMVQNADLFKRVMSQFPTGVVIVTGVDGSGSPVGFTANAVASVSLEPQLVLVCADRSSASLAVLQRTGTFALSVLRAEDSEIARRFSNEIPEQRFVELELVPTRAGPLVLKDALAWAGCRIWKSVEAGDHIILIGEVVDCSQGSEGAPLVFFGSSFGTFTGLSKG